MRLRRIYKVICIVIVILGISQICIAYGPYVMRKVSDARMAQSLKRSEEATSVQETTEGNVVVTALKDTVDTIKETESASEEETVKPLVMLDRFTSLYAQNMDLTGWLTIDGTVIDYPVMRGHSNDDEYYLYRDFYQNDDKYGSLYVRHKADVLTPSTNFIIYGHDMGDGSMFGSLKKYKDASYESEHSKITFCTLYEERTYEIVSVFLSQVYDSDDDVFKYYQFYQADNEDEFYDFYNNIKELALYDTGVTATYGDTFLTLSTCSYQVEDGRLVVVAKLVK